MNDAQHPAPMHYKVINIRYGEGKNWRQTLENELNEWAAKGYRPILYGDAGEASTVILEKISE